MAALIVVGLCFAVAAGSMLMAAAFYDVAFAGPRTAQSSCGCTDCGSCPKGARRQEVLAIASLVQRSVPRHDLEKIRSWTRQQPRPVSDKATCPLMSDDGSCIVFSQLSATETVL